MHWNPRSLWDSSLRYLRPVVGLWWGFWLTAAQALRETGLCQLSGAWVLSEHGKWWGWDRAGEKLSLFCSRAAFKLSPCPCSLPELSQLCLCLAHTDAGLTFWFVLSLALSSWTCLEILTFHWPWSLWLNLLCFFFLFGYIEAKKLWKRTVDRSSLEKEFQTAIEGVLTLLHGQLSCSVQAKVG